MSEDIFVIFWSKASQSSMSIIICFSEKKNIHILKIHHWLMQWKETSTMILLQEQLTIECSTNSNQKSFLCNKIMLISSLKILMKFSAHTWSQSRTNMWILKELFRTTQSYTEAMSIILMRLIKMIRLACCSATTSYFWMLLFSLLIRLACLL